MTFDSQTNTHFTETYDHEEMLLGTIKQVANDQNYLLHYEERDAEARLLSTVTHTYQEQVLMRSVHQSPGQSVIMNYTYDHQGNLLREEVLDQHSKLIGFTAWVYDEQNRVIEEAGISVGSIDQIFLSGQAHESFHLYHEYE